MQQNKREYNPKASLSLRMVAGAYLLYIVFSLIKGFGNLEEKDILFNIIFIVLFSIAGVVILVTSIISLMKLSKEEKNQDKIEEQMNEEQGKEEQENEEQESNSPIDQGETSNLEEDNSKKEEQ